jgi:hypothetical protein
LKKGWVKVYQTTEIHKIELIKALLEENDIQSVSFNKLDSSYLAFGEIELYVKQEDAIQALHLINNN